MLRKSLLNTIEHTNITRCNFKAPCFLPKETTCTKEFTTNKNIAVKFRYIRTKLKCMLFLSRTGKCSDSNHNSTHLGKEVSVAINSTTCLNNFKPKGRLWLRLWLKSIKFPRRDGFVNVTLKNYNDGRAKKSWKLTSNDSQRMTNFDVQEAGDWFQIRKSSRVSFDVHYMSYNSS